MPIFIAVAGFGYRPEKEMRSFSMKFKPMCAIAFRPVAEAISRSDGPDLVDRLALHSLNLSYLVVHRRSADRCATHMCNDRPRGRLPCRRSLIYRIPTGTTLMLLNGEPLMSFVLTTV